MRIWRFTVGRVPFRRLRIGLLASGIASLLTLAGVGPAGASGPLTAVGNGMTITVVSVQLVNKVAVNVNFSVTCSTANDVAADGGTEESPADTYFVIAGFTLTENVKGTIVSNQITRGSDGNWPYVNCNGTPQPFTAQLVQTSGPGYKPGPAYASNGQAGAFDSDASCGNLGPAYNYFPAPCDTVSFSGGVQINGGTS
jgi:hypothetical protein